MANFVSDTNSLLDSQNQGSSASCPFVIVLSDGRFNKDNVRKYIREAKDKRYLYIFVVLDQAQGNEKDTGGIMSLRSASRSATGQMKLTPYLSDFPFDYYCIVRNTKQLPNALGSILVQWFSMITK